MLFVLFSTTVLHAHHVVLSSHLLILLSLVLLLCFLAGLSRPKLTPLAAQMRLLCFIIRLVQDAVLVLLYRLIHKEAILLSLVALLLLRAHVDVSLGRNELEFLGCWLVFVAFCAFLVIFCQLSA